MYSSITHRRRNRWAALGLGAATALAGLMCVPAAAGAAPAAPNHPICDPRPGTVLSSKADGYHVAWQPTTVSSAYVAGPGTITRSYSAASQVGASVSASFSVEEGFLFASAKETYGVTVSGSLTHTATWAYSLSVPSGKTAKVQQYHQAAELGIKQVIVTQTANGCPNKTEESLTGNFFPIHSSNEDTYCYGLTTSHKPGVQVRSSCTNTL